MSFVVSQQQIHPSGINVSRIGVDPITTTNNTPTLVTSIPIGENKNFEISVWQMASRSDGSTRNVGTRTGVFYRTTGNISQEGTLKNSLTGILTGAQISFTINNTTKEVEIYAGGLAATTINWRIYIDLTFNT